MNDYAQNCRVRRLLEAVVSGFDVTDYEGDTVKNFSMLAVLVVLLSGCVTKIQPTVTENPPPSRAFSTFKAFEIRPLATDPGVEEPEAVKKIQEYLDAKIGPLVKQWNRGAGDTLVIEPRIHELKFVSGTHRVFAGSMAGSSAVRMTFRITNKATGELVAQPEFYQRAAAMGGAYSFGSTDNQMLERICTVSEQYLERNYVQAVGGPTGLEAN